MVVFGEGKHLKMKKVIYNFSHYDKWSYVFVLIFYAADIGFICLKSTSLPHLAHHLSIPCFPRLFQPTPLCGNPSSVGKSKGVFIGHFLFPCFASSYS